MEGLREDGKVKLSQSNTVILNTRAGANTVDIGGINVAKYKGRFCNCTWMRFTRPTEPLRFPTVLSHALTGILKWSKKVNAL